MCYLKPQNFRVTLVYQILLSVAMNLFSLIRHMLLPLVSQWPRSPLHLWDLEGGQTCLLNFVLLK